VKTAVIDSSAFLRFYLPDGPVPTELEELVEAAVRAEAVLLAPELALAEVTQVLHKKERDRRLNRTEADEILEAFLALPVRFIPHRELVPDALALARTYNVSVYDGIFIALAKKHRVGLITADVQLEKIFRKSAARE
jgi:predicted nucleic acid-binding protein